MFRQILVMAAVFAVLQLGWQALGAAHIAPRMVELLVVLPAAWAVNLLTPDVQATAVGVQLHAAGGSLNVINGCDGTDLLFLLIGAFCVAPLSRRARIGGVMLGVVVVHVLNQARLLALFYAARTSPAWFDALHGMLAPLAVVGLLGGYFYLWLRVLPPRIPSSAAA